MTRPEPSRHGAARLESRLALPAGFRPDAVLAFHGRDAAELAERVEAEALHKGILWNGAPACLSIRFAPREARVRLMVDGASGDDGALAALAARMLGLTQPIEAFEERHARHPRLGALIARNRGLRIPLAASPFEALCWAVTGQQISVSAAISIRRRLIQAAGTVHSGGLHCFPDAPRVLALGDQGLRAAGFSRAKTGTLLDLCEAVEGGALPLDDWLESPPVEEIRERLLQVRGIGPWTVAYALLRGYGALDGSLHGDVAVRRNLQVLLGSPEPVSAEQARRWLEPFSPWRALLAAHLWAMQARDGY